MARKYFIAFLVPVLFLVPSVSFASTLTQPQVDAILALLAAFNVDSATIGKVEATIEPFQAQIPSAPSNPVVVDISVLSQRYAQLFPKGLHGTVGLWADQLVRQDGEDIAVGSDITYSLDGTVLGSPTGILGDYSFPLDTTKYANGTHQLTVAANDGNGNSSSATLQITIAN